MVHTTADREPRRNMLRGSLWQLLTSLFSSGAEFVVVLRLASCMEPARFGALMVAWSAVKIVFLLCEPRIHESLIPKLSRYLGRSRRGTWNSLRWGRRIEGGANLMALLACCLLAAGVALGQWHRFDAFLICACAVYGFGNTFLKYSSLSVFRSLGEMQGAACFAGSAALAKLLILFLGPGEGAANRLLLMGVVVFGVAVLQGWWCGVRVAQRMEPTYGPSGLRLSDAHRNHQVKLMASNYGTGLLEIAHRELDVQVLAWLTSPLIAGGYRLAKTMANLMQEALNPMILMLLPETSRRLSMGNWNELKAFLRRVTGILGILGASAGLSIIGLVWVYLTYWNPSRVDSVFPVVVVLIGTLALVAPWLWTQSFLLSLGEPQAYFRASAVGATVGLIAALLLIPRYQAIGAALSQGIGLGSTVWISKVVASRRLAAEVDP